MKIDKDEILKYLDLDGLGPITSNDLQINCYWVSNESLQQKELTFDNCSLSYLPIKGWNDQYKEFLEKHFKNVKEGIYSTTGKPLIFINTSDDFLL